jgi:hypothetical protein
LLEKGFLRCAKGDSKRKRRNEIKDTRKMCAATSAQLKGGLSIRLSVCGSIKRYQIFSLSARNKGEDDVRYGLNVAASSVRDYVEGS